LWNTKRSCLNWNTFALWISGFKSTQSFSNNYTNASINTNISLSSATLEKLSRLRTDSSKKSSAAFDKMSAEVQIEMKDPDGKILTNIVSPQSIEILPERTLSIPISFQLSNPLLWSVESPNLYTVTVKIVQNQ
jgi:beta-galactosidase/beta-glucuronidase